MSKTKQIGVRFDKDKLELIMKDHFLKTPQQVVNYLMDQYPFALPSLPFATGNTDSNKVKVVRSKQVAVTALPDAKTGINIPPMPVKRDNEDSISYAARKNEWKRLYSNV